MTIEDHLNPPCHTIVGMKKRRYGRTLDISVEKLREVFQTIDSIEIALLFGSRASGDEKLQSDYDIALKITPAEYPWGAQAHVWSELVEKLDLREYDLDIVDLDQADPWLLKAIYDNHIPLKGEASDLPGLSRKNQGDR